MNSEFLTFVAMQAALRGGELLKRGFGTSFQISSKEGKMNLVTEYDKSAEVCIIDAIKKHFPHHAFIAEESGASGTQDADVVWIIDPLDGTVNFAYGIPMFSVSIAAANTKTGEILCGVVYHPLLAELFVAERHKGAYLNGSILKVSDSESFDDAVMATGFPYNVHENPLHCIDHFSKMTRMGIPIRRLGSAALDLAYLAAGRFDVYWEVSLHPWDSAAGKLLVQEAGGIVTHYDGSFHETFTTATMLATNGRLHEKMIEQLKS